MTKTRSINFGTMGLALGALALLVAIVHFWIAMAAPEPAIEDMIADNVVAIRDSVVDRWKGRVPEPAARPWDREHLVTAATALFGGLAVVCAAIGYVRKESARVCIMAAMLGVATIAVPFVVGMIGALIVITALAALLGPLS